MVKYKLLVTTIIFSPTLLTAEEIIVSDRDALMDALQNTSGGDVIIVDDGNYGSVNFTESYSEVVTLRSKNDGGARFERLEFSKNASNVNLENLSVDDDIRAVNASNLSISHTIISGMIYARDVETFSVVDSEVKAGTFALVLNNVAQFQVLRNLFGGASEDLIRITGKSHSGLLEYNVLHDVVSEPPKHPDFLQIFAAEGVTPHDIIIRRNVFYDDPKTGPNRSPQGIYISDAGDDGYRNIRVEENLISVSSPNSIFITGGVESVLIRNNTLIPSSNDSGAVIRLSDKSPLGNSGVVVEGNVAKTIMDETRDSSIGSNYLYGRNARLGALFSGTGARWQDYVPVIGSDIDLDSGYGAHSFLSDLLKLKHPVER
ncbi:right-handed parallel beta-helix repeat-containing protein [Cereibacter sp. SYSU M97828]|nr:right-handed parallel beta-helix repeat-containing protein [Cereibacter flavus]